MKLPQGWISIEGPKATHAISLLSIANIVHKKEAGAIEVWLDSGQIIAIDKPEAGVLQALYSSLPDLEDGMCEADDDAAS